MRAKLELLGGVLVALTVLAACSAPVRPPAKAVPPETLKVNPALLKTAPATESNAQSK